MASAQDIINGRKADHVVAKRNRDAIKASGPAGTINFRNPDLSRAHIRLFGESGGSRQTMKIKAVRDALDMVHGRGFTLPDMAIYMSDSPGVQCIACMGAADGSAEYVVFMGPKTGQHTPQAKAKDCPYEGGAGPMGSSAMRGIADQVYDGTQRWFGNPKMKSHATMVVVHELGHVLHEYQSTSVFWDQKRQTNATIPASAYLNAALQISQYAAGSNTSLEFVAEAFAGTIAGKTYSPLVKNAYTACSGPMPSGNWM